MSVKDQDIDLLRHHARVVVRELGLHKEQYHNIGVTLAMRHLLIELTEVSPATVNEIARRLLLDKSSASRLIQKAVKKGFVKYEVDPQDKRRRSLQMTEKGKETLQAFEVFAKQEVRDSLKVLSKDEVHAVFRGMALFARGLKEARKLKKTGEKT